MQIAETIVMVLHIIASLVLIVVVLLQSGKAAGLSGTIAGGAETFFGKNKGRTIDAILEKWTAFFAILFLITSIALALIIKWLAATPVA
ncbi:MAG TPA: preprotein translocase subunit SecG [Candidatus Aphodoplasma excrementigallinarum]|uniref:Protein-export membrane protein SecG n=1 Tax=Candidatus Aphodoplasma excrementigallinarum TaxID=2840673 RepID=A0A9D1SZW1_9FIRM|nr:preprotein translocase subunit SecG [Candidatus Aphodoplasma excrementigallinarum]